MRDGCDVVIASRLFPPEVSAGAFRLGALARALAEQGSHVAVLTTTPSVHAPAISDSSGVDVHRWPVLRDAGGNVRGYLQYLSFDVPLLGRLLARRFDVVVAESPPTTGLVVMIGAALKRRPFVYYAADVWTDGVISMGAPRVVVSVMRWMECTVLAHARLIISVSDEVTERLVLLGAEHERIVTVGNGIDTDVFNPLVEPASNQEYFVYTGTMSEWQRPDIFIRAFALIAKEHPELQLRFFGQGSVEAELKTLAQHLVPGRVFFGGVVSPVESTSWIRGAVASLVSIVPGIGYDFAKPTKTYAAAATGTPVLFTGPVAGAELVRGGRLGLAVDFTPDAVAEAMRVLLTEATDGTTEQNRQRRARWAQQKVSLRAVASRAAQAVSQVGVARVRKLGRSVRTISHGGERPTL